MVREDVAGAVVTPGTGIDDVPTLTQYRDPITGRRVSTVLCDEHARELLARLRRIPIGSGSCPAGSLSKCDRCEDDR